MKKSQWCHWNKMTLPSHEFNDAAKAKNNLFKKINNVRWKQNDYIIEFIIYNHWFILLKMMIELLNSFKVTFVKCYIFVIIFQFIIVILILWWLLKHDKIIKKTMLITQYTNSCKICSKLFYKNKALTNEDSMLINLILFFWFCLIFFLCEHGSYDSFILKWWNDVVTSRCFCLLKRFFISGLGFRIFFSFNPLIVSIVLPHGPTPGWCQIGVWDKSKLNQMKSKTTIKKMFHS